MAPLVTTPAVLLSSQPDRYRGIFRRGARPTPRTKGGTDGASSHRYGDGGGRGRRRARPGGVQPSV